MHRLSSAVRRSPSLRVALVVAAGIGTVTVYASGLGSRWAVGDVSLSPAQRDARRLAFEQSKPFALPRVAPNERSAALATMNLEVQPSDVRDAMRDGGGAALSWLTLADDMSEDGDVIQIVSHHYRRTITLTNEPIRVAVPAAEPGVVHVRGVFDGGGGITVAVVTPRGQVTLPSMTAGEEVALPIESAPAR